MPANQTGMRPRKSKKRKLTKSEQMARVRSKNTRPELIFRKALWNAGLRYVLQPDLPGTPDLAIISRKIAIFVDGCFWHGCAQHYRMPTRNAEFWKLKIERNLRRDRRTDRDLAELGWITIRIWEHEISHDLAASVRRIERLVKSN